MTAEEHDEISAVDGDAEFLALHRKHHARALDHVRVHLAWARWHLAGRSPLRALGHAFAGLLVAAPASLLQRYTGLVVPAFDVTVRQTASGSREGS